MRRAYCEKFSGFYDRFVALHSRDTEGLARKFPADRLPVQNGGSVLDVCTGTATESCAIASNAGVANSVPS
jgi:ubiquinone/menaquinone biosynthesis C-methylase UbiE